MDKKVIILPNGLLANNSLTNVTSNDFRLLELKVGISYSADLKKAKAILERLLREEPRILTEEEHVVFVNDLADSAVILGLRAQVKTENYWPTRWKLLEEIKLTFDAEGIEIPYPQMDIHMRYQVLCASGTRLAPTEAERRPCVSCSAAEQFVGMYLHKMNTLQRVLKYSIIVG